MSDPYTHPHLDDPKYWKHDSSSTHGVNGGWGAGIGNDRPSQPITAVSDYPAAPSSQEMTVYHRPPASPMPLNTSGQVSAYAQGSDQYTAPASYTHHGHTPVIHSNPWPQPPQPQPQQGYSGYSATQFSVSAESSNFVDQGGQQYPQAPLSQQPPFEHNPGYPSGRPQHHSTHSATSFHAEGHLVSNNSNNPQTGLMPVQQYGQWARPGTHHHSDTEVAFGASYSNHHEQNTGYQAPSNTPYGQVQPSGGIPQSTTSGQHASLQASYEQHDHQYSQKPNANYAPLALAGQQAPPASSSQSSTHASVNAGYQHSITHHVGQQGGKQSGKWRILDFEVQASLKFGHLSSSRAIDGSGVDENDGHSQNSGGTADDFYSGN